MKAIGFCFDGTERQMTCSDFNSDEEEAMDYSGQQDELEESNTYYVDSHVDHLDNDSESQNSEGTACSTLRTTIAHSSLQQTSKQSRKATRPAETTTAFDEQLRKGKKIRFTLSQDEQKARQRTGTNESYHLLLLPLGIVRLYPIASREGQRLCLPLRFFVCHGGTQF
jgi:hypothetical protein